MSSIFHAKLFVIGLLLAAVTIARAENASVDQLIKTKIAKLGENIGVARFTRFKVGGE